MMNAMLMMLAIMFNPAQSSAQSEVPLPNEIARIASIKGQDHRTVELYRRRSRDKVLLAHEIPNVTRAFSERMLRESVRLSANVSIQWQGYWTPGHNNEVMSASWTGRLGKCSWVDNGLVASIHCELTSPTSPIDEESVLSLIESVVPELLNAPYVDRKDFRHWMKPVDTQETLWAGIVCRNVKFEEVTLSGGQVMLKPIEEPEWHQRLEVTTDGLSISIYFEMREYQVNPFGGGATPNSYRPFRFTWRDKY